MTDSDEFVSITVLPFQLLLDILRNNYSTLCSIFLSSLLPVVTLPGLSPHRHIRSAFSYYYHLMRTSDGRSLSLCTILRNRAVYLPVLQHTLCLL